MVLTRHQTRVSTCFHLYHNVTVLTLSLTHTATTHTRGCVRPVYIESHIFVKFEGMSVYQTHPEHMTYIGGCTATSTGFHCEQVRVRDEPDQVSPRPRDEAGQVSPQLRDETSQVQGRRCLLCGTGTCGITFRKRTVAFMLKTLERDLQETPFVWRYVHDHLKRCSVDTNGHTNAHTNGMKPNDAPLLFVDVCTPCAQWLHRAKKYASQQTDRYMLLVDQLFMCVLHPGRARGKTGCIQARVYTRILSTLRQPTNPLILLCPPIARLIIARKLRVDHKKPLMHIMHAFWEMSGSPEMLPSAEVARAVRSYIE